MEPRISLVTLGVTNIPRSARFYEEVLGLPRLPTPPEVAFFEVGKTWLGLYGRTDLAADAGVPAAGSGFPGFSLAHNVASEAEVDALLEHVRAHADHGGRVVREAHKTDWGGYSGYFSDPDGFLWEVAWNPHFPHV